MIKIFSFSVILPCRLASCLFHTSVRVQGNACAWPSNTFLTAFSPWLTDKTLSYILADLMSTNPFKWIILTFQNFSIYTMFVFLNSDFMHRSLYLQQIWSFSSFKSIIVDFNKVTVIFQNPKVIKIVLITDHLQWNA